MKNFFDFDSLIVGVLAALCIFTLVEGFKTVGLIKPAVDSYVKALSHEASK